MPLKKSTATGKRGPKAVRLTDTERAEFIGLIRSGFAKVSACQHMKISWDRLDRELRIDPAYRREFRHAQIICREQLVMLMYARALSGEARALEFMIGRFDAADRARTLRRDALRAAKLAEGRQQDRGDFDVTLLTLDELNQILDVLARAEARRAAAALRTALPDPSQDL